MSNPIDYTAVLADLEAKRSQIDAAIAVIRTLIGTATPNEGNEPGAEGVAGVLPIITTAPRIPSARQQNSTIESDTFFGLSTSDAVRKFLGMMKRPQTPRAIADALHQGGQVHSADPEAAYRNVYTALSRSKDFAKTRNKEWGLAEWYSGKSKAESE